MSKQMKKTDAKTALEAIRAVANTEENYVYVVFVPPLSPIQLSALTDPLVAKVLRK